MFICHIYILDEQERVQKKTFVNWINSYLSKVSLLSKKIIIPLEIIYIYKPLNFDWCTFFQNL